MKCTPSRNENWETILKKTKFTVYCNPNQPTLIHINESETRGHDILPRMSGSLWRTMFSLGTHIVWNQLRSIFLGFMWSHCSHVFLIRQIWMQATTCNLHFVIWWQNVPIADLLALALFAAISTFCDTSRAWMWCLCRRTAKSFSRATTSWNIGTLETTSHIINPLMAKTT